MAFSQRGAAIGFISMGYSLYQNEMYKQ